MEKKEKKQFEERLGQYLESSVSLQKKVFSLLLFQFLCLPKGLVEFSNPKLILRRNRRIRPKAVPDHISLNLLLTPHSQLLLLSFFGNFLLPIRQIALRLLSWPRNTGADVLSLGTNTLTFPFRKDGLKTSPYCNQW